VLFFKQPSSTPFNPQDLFVTDKRVQGKNMAEKKREKREMWIVQDQKRPSRPVVGYD
jgi:hypothetical protein